jgi:hypothetical protein
MANNKTKTKATREPETEEKVDKKRNNKQGGNKRRNDKRSKEGANEKKAVNASSALLNAAGNISFPVAAGLPISLVSEKYDNITISGLTTHRIPGVMRFGFIATFGRMKSWTDAANVWIRKVYTYIRHQNSGHTNYDAASLGMYLLAYRSALDYLKWMCRLYGVIMGSYVPMNKYTPRSLVLSMHADYDTLVADAAKLRYYIISYASRLNQMKVPNFKFYQQDDYLLKNVFADADTLKCSMYVFDPDAYWVFRTATVPENSGMFLEFTGSKNWNYSTIRDFGEGILNPILNSEDFNIMSGDIMKAYQDYCPVPIVEETHSVYPTFDPNILWSIHNARPLCTSWERFEDLAAQWFIKQDLSVNTASSGAMVANFKINFGTTNPTTETARRDLGHLLMNTQCALIDAPMDVPDPTTIAALTEFITMTDNNGNVTDMRTTLVTSAMVISQPDGAPERNFDYDTVGIISGFDMHPYVYDLLATYNKDTNKYHITMGNSGPMGEVTNISTLYPDVKRRIDEAIVLDMFAE